MLEQLAFLNSINKMDPFNYGKFVDITFFFNSQVVEVTTQP